MTTIIHHLYIDKDHNPIQSINSEISNFYVPLFDLWDEGERVRS